MSDCELDRASQGQLRRVLGRSEPRIGADQRIVDGAFSRLRRRRRIHRAVLGGIAAAAVAAACIVLWIAGIVPRSPTSTPPRQATGRRAVARPVGLPDAVAGRRWTTDASPVTHRLGRHRVTLSPGATVVAERAQPPSIRLHVLRGRALFEVAPLPDGATFAVRTRHVSVAVVGTRFAVAASDRCSLVRVFEGTVRATVIETSQTELLSAGSQQTYCSSETLSEGGALIQRALDLLATNQDLPRADGLLTRYLDLYPDGPLAEEALFYLVFAKQRRGQAARARALAHVFLKRFRATPRADRIRAWLEKKNEQP